MLRRDPGPIALVTVNSDIPSRSAAKGAYQMRPLIAIPFLLLSAVTLPGGCVTTSEPGIEVRTVERVVEVQRPCPGVKPERPAPLGPVPADAVAALALTAAKLAEYTLPGMYADKAEAIMERCLSDDSIGNTDVTP